MSTMQLLCAICGAIVDTFFSGESDYFIAYAYYPIDSFGRTYEEQVSKLLPLLKDGSQIITIDHATSLHFHNNDHNGRSLKATG